MSDIETIRAVDPMHGAMLEHADRIKFGLSCLRSWWQQIAEYL